MLLDELMQNEGDAVYYSDGLRAILEDHISFFKQVGKHREMFVEQNIAYKYEYDFDGFLNHNNIPPKYHWIVMRCNDITSPHVSIVNRTTIIIPDFDIVEKIKQTHYTTNRIK